MRFPPPSPLFTHIKNYPGARIFANPLAKWSRVALAMGMDAKTSPVDIIKEYAHRSQSPIKPVLGFGVSEVGIAGGLRREPVELVKCETVDLLVPAHAEIIIEGTVMPHERKEEGPFGEYTGYNAGGRDLRPVFHVQAVTHRKAPILSMSNMGTPVDDADIACSLGFLKYLSATFCPIASEKS